MARYIVIEVSSNAVAEKLLERLNDQTKKGSLYRVVGLFVKPGRTCECVNWRTANYRENREKHGWSGGVERGEKFGWWVCTNCKKPRKAGHNLVNQLKMSECYSELDPLDPNWEFGVTNLGITSIALANIERPKKLRRKKKNG
jgi:hypothetical protein